MSENKFLKTRMLSLQDEVKQNLLLKEQLLEKDEWIEE